MEALSKGDVVLMDFPFSDLTASKKRPALVITNLKGEDFILCQITSKTRVDDYAIVLSDDDFSEGTLHLTSLVRPNRIFTAHVSLIDRKIGCLRKKKIEEIVEEVCKILKS